MKKKNLIILLIAILTALSFVSCDGLEIGSIVESEVVQAATAGNLTDFIGASLAGESVTIPDYVTTLTYTYSTKDGTKTEAKLTGGSTLTLAEGVYSFTYGDTTFSAYVYSESDAISANFDGGFGTSAYPYLISDAESFLSINEVGVSSISGLSGATQYYFRLENDISIAANSWFSNYLYMDLDGNGHLLTIEDPPMDIEYTSDSEFALFYLVKGNIRNLDFRTNGMKGLVYYAYGSLTIENVDAYGEVDGIDSNIGVYVVKSYDVDLKFKDCTNYANIIDSVGGNYYGAVFLGYAVQGTQSSLTFENCVNYGEIIFGQWAAMFIGNGAGCNDRIKSITIKDCYNYAPITGGTNASIIVAYSDLSNISTSITFTDTASSVSASTKVADFDSTYASYVNKEGGSIGKLSDTISNLNVNEGVVSFTSSAAYDTVATRVQFSVSYKNGSSSLGSRTMTFDAAEVSSTSVATIDSLIKEVHLIDTVTGASQLHSNLEYDESSKILYVDPWAYYTSSSYNSGYTINVGSTINYYLILRKDGKIVGLNYVAGGTLSADSSLTST